MALVTGDYNVYSRKGGADLYFHTFVLWASDLGWIEQTLNSHRSPPETEVFVLLPYNGRCDLSYIFHPLE